MDAKKAIITQIFNNATLIEVPFFQRAYVWKEDLWERFLDDMEYVTKTDRSHFLGSIIFKEENEPEKGAAYASRLTIVDGQQRLTTFLVFLKALCLKTKQDFFDIQFRIMMKDIAMRHGKNDIHAFNKVTSLKVPETIENPSPGSKIIEAFNYFLKNIDTEKLDLMSIIKNIQFVRIDLNKDEDEQQIFDSLNSLGVNLTTSELLKNYFFNRETVKDYEEKWASIFEKDDETKAYWDNEIETGRMKRAMIDIFFDSYFQMFIQDKTYNISAEDKITYARLDQLAQSYQHFINKYCNGNKNIVLNQMNEYADSFMKTFKPEYCDISIPKKFGIERLNVIIFGLKTTTLLPYVLFIAKNVSDKNEYNNMCGILESYLMRRMVVHATTKNYNNLFSSLILNSVTDADTLKDRLQKANDWTSYVPSDKELLEGFLNSRLTNTQTKGIIYLLESHIRPDNTATTLLSFNQYSLEHLMPKKWRNNWEPCETDEKARIRDFKLLTLGNLAIITQSLNASIRDSDWDTKKTGKGENKPGLSLCAAGLITMHDVLQKEKWTEEDIDDRASWLCDKAISTWDIVPEFDHLVNTGETLNSSEKKALRKEYWEYALPLIQKENSQSGMFSGSSPSDYNSVSGYFGIGGFCISCVANYDDTEMVFWLNSSSVEKNKNGFDLLFSHKQEIEAELDTELIWCRADDYKASWIVHHLPGRFVENKSDWEEMAKYHCKMSRKLYETCYPYLKEKW